MQPLCGIHFSKSDFPLWLSLYLSLTSTHQTHAKNNNDASFALHVRNDDEEHHLQINTAPAKCQISCFDSESD